MDGLAVETGALIRRRGIEGGEALVRCLLLLGLKNSTLERASDLARDLGLSTMNKTAYLKRVCKSEGLLEQVFLQTLKFSAHAEDTWPGKRLVAVDATSLSGPAATGTDQKLHTVYDLSRGLPISVEITDRRGGEAVWRHNSLGKGDIVLSDAGYGYNRSFLHALGAGASICIRFNFRTVTLNDEFGERIWAEEADVMVPEEDAIERIVFVPGWEAPLRAIASRNEVGDPVWYLTDLNRKQLPTDKARQLYRRRWQIELYFKRLKSLLDLGDLPTRDGPTARPWIWTKLILASLATLMAYERFSPWGDRKTQAQEIPLGEDGLRQHRARKSSYGAAQKTETGKAKRQAQRGQDSWQAAVLLEA
jgi:hypothetical protein